MQTLFPSRRKVWRLSSRDKMAAGHPSRHLYISRIFYKTSHDDIAMKGIGLEAMQVRRSTPFRTTNLVRRIENERRRRRKRSSRTAETSYVFTCVCVCERERKREYMRRIDSFFHCLPVLVLG